MAKISIDKLMGSADSLFKLSNLAARRAQELSQGGAPLVEVSHTEKPTSVALIEIMNKKIAYKKSKKDSGANA